MSFWAGPAGAAAIQGIGSLVGGLFNRGPKISTQLHAAQLMEERRFQWLVKGAQNAGFNPLTVLGATGGQQAPAPQSPVSRSAVIGNAIATAAQAYDPIRLEREKLENELIKEQINDMRQPKVGVPGVKVSNSPTRAYDLQEDNPYTMNPHHTTLPVVDPTNVRPEFTRVNKGPDKGRYVLALNGEYYLTPKGSSPTALYEEITGSVGAELTGLLSTIQTSYEKVYVNEKGEMIKSRPKARPGQTTVTLDDVRPVRQPGQRKRQP